MRRSLIFLLWLLCSVSLFSQEKMFIHKSDHITLGAPVAKIDSIFFNSDWSEVNFRIGSFLVQYEVSEIDSISFGSNSNTLLINYKGNSVSVVNPLAFEGVSVVVSNSHVTVNTSAGGNEISYNLKGTTNDGMFKIYSDNRFNLIMEGLQIANRDGPAINIQSKKKCTVSLNAGTFNTLNDGTTYAGSTEDQKSAFFSEGQLEFTGTGSLNVKSLSNHAICSDDYISITDGTITVSGAGKDGIHSNDHFVMSGGTLNVTANGDGIECEGGFIDISGGAITTSNAIANVMGIRCDSILTISGGTIKMTVGGNQSKGIKSGRKMNLKGGDITINTTGGVVLVTSGSGFDPAYCDGIKGDEDIEISGGKITISGTGAGNKGISCTKNISITNGDISITSSGSGTTYKNSTGITDSYNSTCITTDGNLGIIGGSVTTSSSGSGGRGIVANGTLTIGDSGNSPSLKISTSGTKFLISGSGQSAEYTEPKAIKADGAITVNNGTINITSNDDGIKSKTSITINGGNISVANSYEGMEAPFITVINGSVYVLAANDGINTTKGIQNGGTEQNDGSIFAVNGGYVVSGATQGDAADCNGNVSLTGGTLILHGPPSQPEEAIDFNGTFNITGGFFIAGGTNSKMNKPMSTSSTQYGLYSLTTSVVAANTIFRIQDGNGNDLVTFKPARNAYSFLFSSPVLKDNTTYSIYTGGTCSGAIKDGLYSGGTYSGGTLRKSFTLSSKVTSLSF